MTGQLLLFVTMSLFSHGDKILLYRTQQELLFLQVIKVTLSLHQQGQSATHHSRDRSNREWHVK